jgi:hypothetical protein
VSQGVTKPKNELKAPQGRHSALEDSLQWPCYLEYLATPEPSKFDLQAFVDRLLDESLAVLTWIKKLFRRSRNQPEQIAHQAPGEVFPWPKGLILTALDDITIALPKALIEPDEPIGTAFDSSDDMLIHIPPEGDVFYIRLLPGISASIRKSSQAYVVAEDGEPRRVRVTRPA